MFIEKKKLIFWLTLQITMRAFDRPISRLVILFGVILSVSAYSSKCLWYIIKKSKIEAIFPFLTHTEYGRTCKDIGCLPSETCAMAYETCSYSQREGKDCGGFPTCKRNVNGGSQTPGTWYKSKNSFSLIRASLHKIGFLVINIKYKNKTHVLMG